MLVLNIPDLVPHWLELYLYIYMNKTWQKAISVHASILRETLVGREESGKCMRKFQKGNTCPKPCQEQSQPFWHAGFDP